MSTRCGNCQFFESLSKTCRAKPPNAEVMGIAGRGPSGEPALQVATFFPQVKETDWCGQHQPGLEWKSQ
jgi:hypothetical protein